MNRSLQNPGPPAAGSGLTDAERPGVLRRRRRPLRPRVAVEPPGRRGPLKEAAGAGGGRQKPRDRTTRTRASRDARGSSPRARGRPARRPGPTAHLAPQQPVAVVAEATFVGTAQRLQGLPAAPLGRHGRRRRRPSETRLMEINKPSNQPPGNQRSLPLPGRALGGARQGRLPRLRAPLPVPSPTRSAPAHRAASCPPRRKRGRAGS